MYGHIRRHLTHCAAAGLAETTREDRGLVLSRVHHEAGHLHRLTTDQLADWLAGPGDHPWAAQTKLTYLLHLRGYFRWALAHGFIATDPTVGLIRPRVRGWRHRTARPDAITTTLTRSAEPWRTAARLAWYAGLRACEIARLTRADVSEQDIVVHGKGGTVATVPTHPALWADLRGRPAGLLVVSGWGRPFTATGLSSRFGRYTREQLGVRATLHALRHAYGNGLRRQGVDLEVVRRLLRHASLNTTQIYLDVDDRELAAAIRQLPAAA